jgi:glycine C-acetyltransferase
MSLGKLDRLLARWIDELSAKGTFKGDEHVITGVKPAGSGIGPRYFLQGYGDRAFLRLNSNSYLGLGLDARVIAAATGAEEQFGAGPGAVRFISGTYQPHVDLERKLAAFHGRDAALVMSAAYATVMSVLPQLIRDNTLVASDALNHNCIINALRLARPAFKAVYPHLDLAELERLLETHKGRAVRAVVVTDGVFSMRGDHAPLDRIATICERHECDYPEGIMTVVDDSHGVGVFGATGRGTEEYTQARGDILIGTLGKAFGVNGGYVVSSRNTVAYLRETAPSYVYSNPITPAEAAAAITSLGILDSPEGGQRLERLRLLCARLRAGLAALRLETIKGDHPIVPVLIRDTRKTTELVGYCFDHNILVTGLKYPVVPKGEEEIRLQVTADQTEHDIDDALDVLRKFPDRSAAAGV